MFGTTQQLRKVLLFHKHLQRWISTKAGGKFELIFRLYGPDKSFFTKTWILPDPEEMK